MPHKRTFGSIEQLPSGKYRARYRGPNNRWYKAPSTFHTKDDAAMWLRHEEKLFAFGEWTPPETRAYENSPLTVGQWVEQWLQLQAVTLKESTLQNYRETLKRRFFTVEGQAARLRDMPLALVTVADVATWWDGITLMFNSPQYNRAAYIRLRTAGNAAVDRGLIGANPFHLKAAAKRPTPHRKELPTLEVLNKILDCLDGSYKVLGVLTLFHGLRIGEALALRAQDVAVDGSQVMVRGSVFRKTGVGMVRLDTPKTAAGFRTVPVFPRFQSLLAEYVASVGGGLLFVGDRGRVMLDTQFRSVLERARKMAGVGVRVTPHYGRVWLITVLAEEGMPIPAIGELLGQKDLKTITEIYMRASEDKRREVLGRVGDKLV